MNPQANDLHSVLAEMRAWRGHTGFPSDRLNQWADRLSALLHGGGGEAVAWLRMCPDGTPDWAEDCIGSDDKFLDYDLEADGYYLRPLAFADTPPPQPRGDMVLVPNEKDQVFALSNWLHNERPEAERALWAGDLVRIVRLLAAAPGEVSGEADRVEAMKQWAHGLIQQLPSTHDGRNSWLLNYGTGEEAEWLRTEHDRYSAAWAEWREGYPQPERRQYQPTTPPPASQSTDPRAQFDSSGKLIAYDARGGGMYGPFPASQSSTNSPETDSKLVGEDASQSAPSAGGGELHAALCFLGELETVGNTRAAEIARGLRRLATAGQVEWDGATRTMQEHLYLMTGQRDRYRMLYEQAAPTIERMERRITELSAAAPTPEQRG